MSGAQPTGRLILAATPLGNVGDASARLAVALATAPIIAAEDTRRLRRLCADLGVAPAGRVISFFDANEASRVPHLIEALLDGQDVLVVTDAGMPAVSDPGYRLVIAAVAEQIAVTALPGPSAVTAALAVSGPARRPVLLRRFPAAGSAGERRRALASLPAEPRTLVLFEAPHRLAEALADLAETFGADRPAAVCRELTKTYEQVRRGGLGELADWARGEVRGEITLVVGGAPATSSTPEAAELARAVADHEEAGESRKEAIAAVARSHALPKRVVYDAVVQRRDDPTSAEKKSD